MCSPKFFSDYFYHAYKVKILFEGRVKMYCNTPVIPNWCFDTKFQLVLPSANVSEIWPNSNYWMLWQRRGLVRPLLIIYLLLQDTYSWENQASQEHQLHYHHDLQRRIFFCLAKYPWKNETFNKTESHDEDSILLCQDAASLEGNPRITAVENSKLTRPHYVVRQNSCITLISYTYRQQLHWFIAKITHIRNILMYRIRILGPLNYLIFPIHILQFLNTGSDFANVLGNTVLLNIQYHIFVGA